MSLPALCKEYLTDLLNDASSCDEVPMGSMTRSAMILSFRMDDEAAAFFSLSPTDPLTHACVYLFSNEVPIDSLCVCVRTHAIGRVGQHAPTEESPGSVAILAQALAQASLVTRCFVVCQN